MNGKLVNASAVNDRTASIINEPTQKRFSKDHKEKYKSYCKITSSNPMGSKGKNEMLINTWCYKNKLFPITIDMIKRDLAIVIFKELSVANKCLQICKEDSNGLLKFFIDRRFNTCRGVIADWPFDIPEWEAVGEHHKQRRICKV